MSCIGGFGLVMIQDETDSVVPGADVLGMGEKDA